MKQNGKAVLVVLCLAASSGLAQTPDQLPSNTETACEAANLWRGALGLCHDWGEPLGCERKEAMLETNQRQQKACAHLAADFRSASSGRELTHTFGVAIVPPEGGSATLEDVASTIFPSGAFTQNTYVRVYTTKSEALDALFRDTAAIYAPLPTTGEQIHINTGLTPPVSDTVTVQVQVPDSLLVSTPSGYAVRLFAQVRQSSDEDSYDGFELFSSVYEPATQTLTAQLPTGVFSDDRTAGAEQEAILILASVRGAWQQEASTPSQLNSETLRSPAEEPAICSILLVCPVAGGCVVTSPFQPVREHPVLGVPKAHRGVDYRAPTGTMIVAAADGQVERSYNSSTYGNTIILRHNDGSATLYAHLSERNVSEATSVSEGQPIGRSGSTGTSTAPHLHFEYVPSGPIIQSPRRIDPEKCREEQCNEPGIGLMTRLVLATQAQYSQFVTPQYSDYTGTTPSSISSSASDTCVPGRTVSGNSSAATYAVSARSGAQDCGINVPSASATTTATLDFSSCAPGATGFIYGEITLQLDTQLQTISFPGIFRQAMASVHGSVSVIHSGGYFSQGGSANVQNGPYEYSWANDGFMSGMPEHGGSKSITVPITLQSGQSGGMQVRLYASVSSRGMSLEPAADSNVSLKLSGVSLFDANGNRLSSQCLCAK